MLLLLLLLLTGSSNSINWLHISRASLALAGSWDSPAAMDSAASLLSGMTRPAAGWAVFVLAMRLAGVQEDARVAWDALSFCKGDEMLLADLPRPRASRPLSPGMNDLLGETDIDAGRVLVESPPSVL